MDALATIVARLDIHQLFATYAHTYDEGRLDRLGELWTEDARFEIRGSIGGFPSLLSGRDEIVAHMRDRHAATQPAQRRHVITNVLIEQLDLSSARVSAYLLLGSTAEGRLSLPVTGRYEDELARTDEGWRIHRQVLTLDAFLA